MNFKKYQKNVDKLLVKLIKNQNNKKKDKITKQFNQKQNKLKAILFRDRLLLKTPYSKI